LINFAIGNEDGRCPALETLLLTHFFTQSASAAEAAWCLAPHMESETVTDQSSANAAAANNEPRERTNESLLKRASLSEVMRNRLKRRKRISSFVVVYSVSD
jgi:hypothetical protein